MRMLAASVLASAILISNVAHADEPSPAPASSSSFAKTISTVGFAGGGILVAAGVITTMASFGSSHCDLTMQPCSKKGAETGAAVGITLMAVGVLAIAAVGIPFAVMASSKDKQTSVLVSPVGLAATF